MGAFDRRAFSQELSLVVAPAQHHEALPLKKIHGRLSLRLGVEGGGRLRGKTAEPLRLG